jgi:hypothetical protein
MQTRYRAAATALLLTATAGLAATGGSAEASGTHHTSAKAAHLTVTITSSKKAVRLSVDQIRPGRTTFKVVRGHRGGGLLEVMRLRKGYSLRHAFSDFGKAFGPTTNVKAVRRIDRNVVFYGGMPAPEKGAPATKWAVDIDAHDKYYAVNLDKNNLSSFMVKGKHQKRSWPSADGRLNMARGNVFRSGDSNANKGWMNSTNNAREPHFVDLEHVKKNTTTQEVADFFANPTGEPTFFNKDGRSAETGVISPRHTFRWHYHLPRGKYLAMCFWPSKVDGTPHAFMGMWKLIDLG